MKTTFSLFKTDGTPIQTLQLEDCYIENEGNFMQIKKKGGTVVTSMSSGIIIQQENVVI